MDSFGERIDYLIKLEGLSARKAAKVFDVSPTHIQKMRTGTSIPGGDVLSKIVAAYPKVDTRWLLTGEGEPFLQSPNPLDSSVHPVQVIPPVSSTPSTGNTPKAPQNATLHSKDVNNIYNLHLYVPEAAHGGYAVGYADAGYHELGVQEIDLPGLPRPGRTFQVSGDSMEPIFSSGDYVVCGACGDFSEVKSGRVYVLVSATAGISVKYIRVASDYLIAVPANQRDYSPTRYDLTEVREIWEVRWHLTRHFLHRSHQDLLPDDIREEVSRIKAYLIQQNPDAQGRL